MSTILRARPAGRVARLAIAGLSTLAVLGLGAEETISRRVPRVIVVPAVGEPSKVPFGVEGDEFAFEQIYDGRLFPEAAEIGEIAFATAAGFGNPHTQYKEPIDRLLEQRLKRRPVWNGPVGGQAAPNRKAEPGRDLQELDRAERDRREQEQIARVGPSGRPKQPGIGAIARTCTHLRIALATTHQQPEAVNAAQIRSKTENYRVILDETRFDYRARGDGTFDLVFPVRLDPPFTFRPERDGNLLIEITIGSETGALPIYVDAGRSPLVGSLYRLPSATSSFTYPGRGLKTRFLINELILKKKSEPGHPEPETKTGPEESEPGPAPGV